MKPATHLVCEPVLSLLYFKSPAVLLLISQKIWKSQWSALEYVLQIRPSVFHTVSKMILIFL